MYPFSRHTWPFIREAAPGTGVKNMSRPIVAVFLALFLASCATQQKKPLQQAQPDAPPGPSKSQALSEDISAALGRMETPETAGGTEQDIPALLDALLDRYLALSSEEQKDPRLQGSMERLFDISRTMALERNRAPEAISEAESAVPEDELLEVTTFLSPDELKDTLEAVNKAKERVHLGIQIPEDNDEVLAYVRLYQTKLKNWFTGSLERGAPYIPEMKRIFKDEGVPPELVYLGIVESAFKSNAKSRAKALGMWQFMEGTAKIYGLTCDFWEDERLDPWKSARASARYLKTLHNRFGDWNFALASYNCGEGKVIRYLRKYPGKDYWAMRKSRFLRRETKEYVPAILASILIASDPASFGISPSKPAFRDQTASIPVKEPVDLRVLSRHLQVPVEVLSSMNPSLRRVVTPPRPYDLKVPAPKYEEADLFLSGRPAESSLNYVVHTVRKGETIKTIAKKYRSDPVDIQDLNLGISGRLRRGTQILVLPGNGSGTAARGETVKTTETAAAVKKEESSDDGASADEVHVVRKGDTLGRIAKKYGTTVEELCRANRLTSRTKLRIGQKIRIP